MLDWEELRTFLAACRAGSVAAAARALRVDETTVARRIARLEAQLGGPLLERERGALSLTPAGEEVRASAEEMERAAIAAERRALGHDQQLSGRVRVTAPEMLGRAFVLPALQRVHEQHPSIALELITTMARLDVTRREADVAVRTARPSEEALIARRLGRMAMTTYVQKPKKRKEPELLSAVAYTDSFKLPLRAAEDRVPGGRVSLRVNSITAAAEAVRLGWGAADLPCWIGDGDAELERAFPSERPTLLDVWLVLHRDVQRTTRVRAVVEAITEHFEACAAQIAAGEP